MTRSRLLNGESWNGTYQWTETQYDAHGRVYKQYIPCTTTSPTTSCRASAVTNTYDDLNRLTQASRPRTQLDSNPQTTTYSYAGRTQSITDARNQTTTRVVNVNSTVRQIEDANHYKIKFAYDAAGSLKGVTDDQPTPRLSDVTVHYGIRPFQVAATDSAMGPYTRTYNSLGELIGWTDAKEQEFSATYDVLSRPKKTQLEPSAAMKTEWTWGDDNDLDPFNKGKLRQVSSTADGVTYSETYTYDNRTRLQRKAIAIPGQANTFYYDFAYGSQNGQLDTLIYPESVAGYRLALKYAYQNGILKNVSDANAPTTVFWKADNTNSWGQTTQETLGNNVITTRAFDAVNARLSSIRSGPSGNPTSIQNLSYDYDLVGNVTLRQNSSLTETFFYEGSGDNLYRLEHSTLENGPTNETNLKLTYDLSGNILTKEEPVLPRPISQSITWTPDNYPAEITAGGQTASFSYGPDRQRWKMVFNDGSNPVETTYYIGGLLEKVEVGGVPTFRHTILGGNGPVAIDTRPSSGTPVLRYMLGDHQGSTETFVEDGTGTVMNTSFSAFGLRRDTATWSGEPTNRAALEGITRQGYTYQTVLGSMGLNHMNGRVQDAVSGRFLSADPYITAPGYTQNYNRYSYVYNNPLSYTDPSGFEGCGPGYEAYDPKTGRPLTEEEIKRGGRQNGTETARSMSEHCRPVSDGGTIDVGGNRTHLPPATYVPPVVDARLDPLPTGTRDGEPQAQDPALEEVLITAKRNRSLAGVPIDFLLEFPVEQMWIVDANRNIVHVPTISEIQKCRNGKTAGANRPADPNFTINGAIAVIHTHPNWSLPFPGPKDGQIPSRFGIPNYGISPSGIWVVSPGSSLNAGLISGSWGRGPNRERFNLGAYENAINSPGSGGSAVKCQ